MANEVGKAQCWNPSGIVVYRDVSNGLYSVTSSFEKDMIQGDSPVAAFILFLLDIFGESSCLGMQLKVGGRHHLKLNIDTRPIANKYREGKMKSTLERGFKEDVKPLIG